MAKYLRSSIAGSLLRTSPVGPRCRIDAGLPLAFTSVVTNQTPFSFVRRVAALCRLFCVLAVAIVTTHYSCRLTAAQASQPTAICAPTHQGAPEHANLSGEKCHHCTMISLLASSVVLAAPDESADCNAAPVHDLASFNPRQTSPPPKA